MLLIDFKGDQLGDFFTVLTEKVSLWLLSTVWTNLVD